MCTWIQGDFGRVSGVRRTHKSVSVVLAVSSVFLQAAQQTFFFFFFNGVNLPYLFLLGIYPHYAPKVYLLNLLAFFLQDVPEKLQEAVEEEK